MPREPFKCLYCGVVLDWKELQGQVCKVCKRNRKDKENRPTLDDYDNLIQDWWDENGKA